jgi:hypothetical protein
MINKFIRIQVIGFFIFTILLLGNVYSNSEVFLKQEATGENIEKARANALALLSQNFLVFVKSDFESNISVENIWFSCVTFIGTIVFVNVGVAVK